MKLKDLVKSVVQTVFTEATEIKLKEATLADGSKVSFDKLEKTMAINRVAADGTLTPLEDGDFVIDKQTVTVKAGLIEDVKPETPVATTPATAPVIAAVTPPLATPADTAPNAPVAEIGKALPDGTYLDEQDNVIVITKGLVESVTPNMDMTAEKPAGGTTKVTETTVTETKASEYIALAEFDKMRTEFTAQLAEMSKRITDSGIKMVPTETIIIEQPKTKAGKVLARLGYSN